MTHSSVKGNHLTSMLADALKGLGKECCVINKGQRHMYEATVDVARIHLLFRNGLDEGVPVLMKDCLKYFDGEPFSAEGMQELAMEDLAEKAMEDKWKVSCVLVANVKAEVHFPLDI